MRMQNLLACSPFSGLKPRPGRRQKLGLKQSLNGAHNGRPEMDDVDISAERAEKEAPYLIAASRKPEGPVATGRCLYCDEIVGDEQRWCDAEHRDAWMREKARKGGVR